MEKIWNEMYEAAKAVLNARRISEYVTCGEVSAAVLSKWGSLRGASFKKYPSSFFFLSLSLSRQISKTFFVENFYALTSGGGYDPLACKIFEHARNYLARRAHVFRYLLVRELHGV
jgi:hypothetical protein